MNYSNRKRLLSDSSSNEEDSQNDDCNPSMSDNNGSMLDALEDYTTQIMAFFKSDKKYSFKFSQVKEIVSAVANYFSSGDVQAQGVGKLRQELQRTKEELVAMTKFKDQLENTVIEARKEKKSFQLKIERLEAESNSFQSVISQQKMSEDLLQMLKESHRRIEEDNKYLKECIGLQKDLFAEKEQVWSSELLALKQKFAGGGTLNKLFKREVNYVEFGKTCKRREETPERKENDGRGMNFADNSEYVTLHHQESASSRESVSRSNLSRGAFDHFIKESNVMKDSLLKHT
jgi:hypothetical protein